MRTTQPPAEQNFDELLLTLSKRAFEISSDLNMDAAPALAANGNTPEGRMREMYANQDFTGKPAKSIIRTFERQDVFNNNTLMTEPTPLNIFIAAAPTRVEQDKTPVISLAHYERDNIIPITGRAMKLAPTG